MIVIQARVLEQKNTSANWQYVNPVLPNAEIGWEVDGSGNPVGLKMGDGVTAWNALPYWFGNAKPTPIIASILAGTTPNPKTFPYDNTKFTNPGYFIKRQDNGEFDNNVTVNDTGTGFTVTGVGATYFDTSYKLTIFQP